MVPTRLIVDRTAWQQVAKIVRTLVGALGALKS